MKKSVVIVLILYFFQGFIHNLGHPITPDLVGDLGISDKMFGVFFALMSLGLVVGGPFWGILGDYGKKRNFILIGLIIYSIGQFTFGNIHNLTVMIIVRFVSGFGVSASVTLLMSYLIEISEDDNKKRNIAFGTASMALGASIGYLLGGILPQLLVNYDAQVFVDGASANVKAAEMVFLIQAVLNTIFAVVTFKLVRNGIVKNKTENRATILQGFKDIRNMGLNLNVFLISLTFVSIGAINISKYLEVYVGKNLGYGSNGIGVFVFATGIVSIIATVLLVPLIVKLKKDITIMLMVNVLSAIIILITFRINAIMIALYSLFMIYVVLKAIYAPLETSFISSFAKDGEYGKIMGVRQSFFAIGFVVGPLIGGFIYDYNPLLVFDFSVLMFVIASLLILLVRSNIKKELLNGDNKE